MAVDAASAMLLRLRHEGHHDDDHAGAGGDKPDSEDHLDSVRHHMLAEAFWYTLVTVAALGAVLRLARIWVATRRYVSFPATDDGRDRTDE
jgi:hypothetical protein